MKIIKVQKDSQGEITNVMLDDGKVCSISEAITMAKSGKIEGVNVGKTRDGKDLLRSNPDSSSSDNLANLPTFN